MFMSFYGERKKSALTSFSLFIYIKKVFVYDRWTLTNFQFCGFIFKHLLQFVIKKGALKRIHWLSLRPFGDNIFFMILGKHISTHVYIYIELSKENFF